MGKKKRDLKPERRRSGRNRAESREGGGGRKRLQLTVEGDKVDHPGEERDNIWGGVSVEGAHRTS